MALLSPQQSKAEPEIASCPSVGPLFPPLHLHTPAFSEPLEDAQHRGREAGSHHLWINERSGVPTEVEVCTALCQRRRHLG